MKFQNQRPDPLRRVVSLPRALSKLGLCSRTQGLEYIAAGRVSLNGKVSRDPTLRVALERDQIALDENLVERARESIVLALHKPVGYVTTRTDPLRRKTVYDLLPKLDRFLFPVGRLDKETSGLLIFTDDHRLGEALTNPQSHVPKTYEAVVDAPPDDRQLEALRESIAIGNGEVTRPAEVEILRKGTDGATLRIIIDEGKNRQIRRMIAAVGLSVMTLSRVAIGSFRLGSLAPGQFSSLLPAARASLSDRNVGL